MLLLFILFVVALSAPSGPCKVAFRLDEIQDYWLVSTQKAVIQTFADKKVPVSLGIISQSFGLDYDPNSQLVPFINGLLQGGADMEISTMSMDPGAWTNMNTSVQISACQRAKAKLSLTLSANKRAIRTLHCPNNLFTQGTMDALRNCSMSVISSVYHINVANCDGHSFYSSCADTMTPINGIVHLPSQAITSANGDGILLSNSEILSAMEASCNSCGYAVLEVHFREYSDNVTKEQNNTAITNLGSLVDSVKAWPTATFHVLQEMTALPPAPKATPVPVPVPVAVPRAAAPTTVPKAPTPTTVPKSATPKAPNTTVPTPRNTTVPTTNHTNVDTRTSGSASMHPIMFVVLASFILQVLFG